MNALQRAKASIHTLHALLIKTADVREAANRRRTFTAPRATQLVVSGNALVRVVDVNTGACLGFRQTIREARWLQQSLERGDAQPSETTAPGEAASTSKTFAAWRRQAWRRNGQIPTTARRSSR